MPVILRLQNLPWSANASHIRRFFHGLNIPEGGVHIVGGENGDTFIAFETDEDARQAMLRDNQLINNVAVRLFLSSKAEMMNIILKSREEQAHTLNNGTAPSKIETRGVVVSSPPVHQPTPIVELSNPMSPPHVHEEVPQSVPLYGEYTSEHVPLWNHPSSVPVNNAIPQEDLPTVSGSLYSHQHNPNFGFSSEQVMRNAPSSQVSSRPYTVYEPLTNNNSTSANETSFRRDAPNVPSQYPRHDGLYPNTGGCEKVSTYRPPSYPPPPRYPSSSYPPVSSYSTSRPSHPQKHSFNRIAPPYANNDRATPQVPPTNSLLPNPQDSGQRRPLIQERDKSQHQPENYSHNGDRQHSRESRRNGPGSREEKNNRPSYPQHPNRSLDVRRRDDSPPKKRMRSISSHNSPVEEEGYFLLVSCSAPDSMKAVSIMKALQGVDIVPKTGIRIEEDDLGRPTGYAGVHVSDEKSWLAALDTKRALNIDGKPLEIRKSNVQEFHGIFMGQKQSPSVPAKVKVAPTPSKRDNCLQILNLPLNVTHADISSFFGVPIETVFVGKTHNIYSISTVCLLAQRSDKEVDLVLQKNGKAFIANPESKSVNCVRVIPISIIRYKALKEPCEVVQPNSFGGRRPPSTIGKPPHEQQIKGTPTLTVTPAVPTNSATSKLATPSASTAPSNDSKNSAAQSTSKLATPSASTAPSNDSNNSAAQSSIPSDSKSKSPEPPKAPSPSDLVTVIQVNNVPKAASVKEILILFRIDKVPEEKVKRDASGTRMFIPFEDVAACQAAATVKMRMCRGYSVRLTLISRNQMNAVLQPKDLSQKTHSVTITNLPMNATVQQVQDFFSDECKMTAESIQLKRSSLGKPLGVARVTFPSLCEAEKVIKTHTEKLFSGRRISMKIDDSSTA